MAQVYFIKILSELLIPVTREAFKYIQDLKTGFWHRHNVLQTRDCLSHKRYFCLLKCGYKHWKQSDGLKRRRTAAGVYGMSRKLIDAAPGRVCQIRIPDVCSFISEAVLAHCRLGDTCGTGRNPDDKQGAYVCSARHKAVNGRICGNFTCEERCLFHAEAVLPKQAWLREETK